MSRWYRQAAEDKNIKIDESEARNAIYGMDYAEWKAKYQTEATEEQKAAYKKNHPDK